MVVRHGLYLGHNSKPWQDVETQSLTQQHPLGAWFDDADGNIFRYAYNGAGALIPGCLVQNATLGGATTTLQSAMPVVSCALGDTVINVTRNTTSQAASLYKEGLAAIWDASLTYTVYHRRIIDNTAITDTAGTITIDKALPVALTASDRVAAMVNPFYNIIISPTAPTGMCLGGVRAQVTANYYCWVQTRGWFATYFNDVTTNVLVGPLKTGATTAGTVMSIVENEELQFIGESPALWLDAGPGIIWLQCE